MTRQPEAGEVLLQSLTYISHVKIPIREPLDASNNFLPS